MTHTMTDEEFVEYQKDKDELAKLKYEYNNLKENISKAASRWFDHNERWLKNGCSAETLLLTKCVRDNIKDIFGCCDCCPNGMFLGCPFGHSMAFSK